MVRITGGDGSCKEKAIEISDCNNMEGVHEERNEIQKRFGTYRLLKQVLINENGNMYDKLLLNIDGDEKVIYFNITDFFGKF